MQVARAGVLVAAIGIGGGERHLDVLDMRDLAAFRHTDGGGQTVGRRLVVVDPVVRLDQRLPERFRLALPDGIGRHGIGFRDRGVDPGRERTALFLRAAAAHALPVAAQLHGGIGIDDTETVVVVVAQRVVGARLPLDDRAVVAAPAAGLGIHLSGGTGQDQRHITPGELGVGLEHQRHHARDHRGGCRGAVEAVGVLVLQCGGGHVGQGGGSLDSQCPAQVGRRGADRQVGAALTVRRTRAGGVGGADGHDAPGADRTIHRGVVAIEGAVAGGEGVDHAQSVTPLAQAVIQRAVEGGLVVRGKEVPDVGGAPAVVVDVVAVDVAHQRIQRVFGQAVGQRIEAHQPGAGRHARDADAVAVARCNHAAHLGAVVVVFRAGHRVVGVPGNGLCILGQAPVVVASGHHVGTQVLVCHFQGVVDDGNADAFTPHPLVPGALHAQVLASHHAVGREAGQAAGVRQIPLAGLIRVGSGPVGHGRAAAEVVQLAARPADALAGRVRRAAVVARRACARLAAVACRIAAAGLIATGLAASCAARAVRAWSYPGLRTVAT